MNFLEVIEMTLIHNYGKIYIIFLYISFTILNMTTLIVLSWSLLFWCVNDLY